MLQPGETRHMPDASKGAIVVPEGALQPGQVLQSRYRISGVLGVGGMGAVYQARDMHFEDVPRYCAVKEMINQAQDHRIREQTFANFRREASLLATLSHPAIPQIFDFFSFGDRAYLVMELIQGKDLEAILNSTPQFLPVKPIIQWAIEVCDVLEYLHTHKPDPIIFRDMKPSNIMIDQHKRVRLIDFGIAKAFQLGQPGTMIGTEGYSPPEQYKGEASPAADIYALGATLHHVLTRKDPRLEPPFSFDQRPIKDINPNVPDELVSIVNRALSYKPENRFATAATMKQMMESLVGGGEQIVPVVQSGMSAPAGAPSFSTPDTYQQQAAISQAPAPGQKKPSGPYAATNLTTIQPLWKFQVEDSIRTTPLVKNGVVYFGAYDNNMWALNAENGELLWKFATEGGIGSSPLLSGGSLFFGSSDKKLYSIQTRNGRLQWSHKTEGKIFSSPQTYGGIIFVGSDDGHIYAIKPGATISHELWRFQLLHPVRSSPAIENERIYCGSDNGDFVCVNFAGELVWRFQSRRKIISSPLIHNNIVYFGSHDWHVYALDADMGMTIWRYRTKGQVVSSPVFHENRVYFGSADGFVYALDALSGNEAWKFEIGSAVTTTASINREALYIGATDGAVYCIHTKTGDLLWRFQTNGPVLSSPVFAENAVYVGSDDKNMYALPG